MDEYMAELARRFAASYISVQMHTSFNTEYRKLKDQWPGELWFSLAQAATRAIAVQGQQTDAFLRAENKGPLQWKQDDDERIGQGCPQALSTFFNAISSNRHAQKRPQADV
jgi:hypothetical protein